MINFAKISAIVVFITTVLFLPGKGQAAERLLICLMEYPPLMGSDIKNYGISPSIATAAFRQVGIDVDYAFFPTSRAFKTAREGKCDALLGFVYSEERAKLFLYSDTVFKAPLLLFHLETLNFDWNAIEDLRGLTIGTTIDNYYGDAFHDALEKGVLKTDESPKDLLQYEKLLWGRIDLFPMNLYTGYYMVHENFSPEEISKITHHLRPLKTSEYHLLFPKALEESSARVRLFNSGLKELQDSGEYTKIIEECKGRFGVH